VCSPYPKLYITVVFAVNTSHTTVKHVSSQEHSQELAGRDKKGVWCAPVGVGDKYGCRLYRNTMKNTKLTNIQINTVKT